MADMKQILIDVDVNRAIEANRNLFSESENDILRRLLLGVSIEQAPPSVATVTQLETAQFGTRSRGHWQSKFGEEVVGATSLKEAYCKLILLAHQSDSNFMEEFSKLIGKSRRFVARKPEALYLNSPHLAKDHAVLLAPGWYIDVNLSTTQVSMRAKSAARVAGLAYGTGVWIKDRGRTI